MSKGIEGICFRAGSGAGQGEAVIRGVEEFKEGCRGNYRMIRDMMDLRLMYPGYVLVGQSLGCVFAPVSLVLGRLE